MADEQHLNLIRKDINKWNSWRQVNPSVKPDFSDAWFPTGIDLRRANLRNALLNGSKLIKADLRGADLRDAMFWSSAPAGSDFRGALLSGADFQGADLSGVNFEGTDLRGVGLIGSNLRKANLRHTDLRGAYLEMAILVETILESANLTGAYVYGVSVWDVRAENLIQKDLTITPRWEPAVAVDDLEVAQFVYILLTNKKIRNVIDTIGEKGVLILGRFTQERKAVLDAIREKLRELGFVPIMFDFEKPTKRDFTETIKILAGMSRFIIADITNPKSSPLELQATMPDYMIPFVPIIYEGEEPFAMFRDLKQKYGEWVLDVLRYDSADNLVKVFDKAVVRPALQMAEKLWLKKAEDIRVRHVRDYL